MTTNSQATFLRALADHLDNHAVPDVVLHWYGGERLSATGLQLPAGSPTIPRLIAWAVSLGATEARLQDLQGTLYVFVDGRIGEHAVEVWGTTTRHPELIGRDRITLAELRASS